MAITKPAADTVIALGQSLTVEWDKIVDVSVAKYELSCSFAGGINYVIVNDAIDKQQTTFVWSPVKAACSNWAVLQIRALNSSGGQVGSAAFQPVVFAQRAPRILMGRECVDNNSSDWKNNMDSGVKKTRTVTRHLTFSPAFPSVPEIFVSLSHIDITREGNAIINAQVDNKTKDGFDLQFITFWDARVCGATASWIAVENPAP